VIWSPRSNRCNRRVKIAVWVLFRQLNPKLADSDVNWNKQKLHIPNINKSPACGGQCLTVKYYGLKGAKFCPKALQSYDSWLDCSPCNCEYMLVKSSQQFTFLKSILVLQLVPVYTRDTRVLAILRYRASPPLNNTGSGRRFSVCKATDMVCFWVYTHSKLPSSRNKIKICVPYTIQNTYRILF